MDINERLQQEQLTSGKGPQVNPDEQNRYLGTFRERVIAAIKAPQVDDSNIQSSFKKLLTQNKDGKLLINQSIVGSSFTVYVKMATQTNHRFTLLSDTEQKVYTDDSIAIVLAADHAVNIDQIYLN